MFIGLHGVVVEDEMQEDGNAFRYIGTSYQELANCDTKGGSRSDDSSGGQNTIKTVVAGRVGVTTGEFQGLEVGDDLISACYTVMERVRVRISTEGVFIYRCSTRNHLTIALSITTLMLTSTRSM